MTSSRPEYPPPPGFVHVDLDGLWTLASCYGYAEGDVFDQDPVFEYALPRLLDLFDRLDVKATFFIVGRDLEHPAKREAVLEIVSRGHDLGNHSYHHIIGLERLLYEDVLREIESTQDAIAELTGSAPSGFRAAGYDAGPRVFRACQNLGIRYDGSSLPTRLAPGLRWVARRLRRKVGDEVRSGEFAEPEERTRLLTSPMNGSHQYGPGSGGLGGIMPQWVRADRTRPPLLRLPLAVSPFFRFPLHASLGMFLGSASVQAGLTRLAARGWPITYLLHGIDAAAPEEFLDRLPKVLSRSRVFKLPLEERLWFLDRVLRELKGLTRVQLTRDYLEAEVTEQTS